MRLDVLIAFFVVAACGGLAMLASWRASRPSNPLKPRMLPWRSIMIAATTGAILALVAAFSLLGAA